MEIASFAKADSQQSSDVTGDQHRHDENRDGAKREVVVAERHVRAGANVRAHLGALRRKDLPPDRIVLRFRRHPRGVMRGIGNSEQSVVDELELERRTRTAFVSQPHRDCRRIELSCDRPQHHFH